jgi:hypothetical protein
LGFALEVRAGKRQAADEQRHAGQDAALLAKRVQVYEAAKANHPQRWSGTTRNWQPVQVVHLNPEQCVDDQKEGNQQLKKSPRFSLAADN